MLNLINSLGASHLITLCPETCSCLLYLTYQGYKCNMLKCCPYLIPCCFLSFPIQQCLEEKEKKKEKKKRFQQC